MLAVVEIFRQRDTVDELGVGVVRDTFSEMLFPGTSTLHTRARYTLFIPWVYRAIERSPTLSQDPWKHARLSEIRLIDALVDSEDSDGTIGSEARATLKMFPSTAYWAVLANWGIRIFPLSQDQYHRWLRAGGTRQSLPLPTSDHKEGAMGAWHANLPPTPEGFPQVASFRFETHEAEYLAERIAMKVPGSLLTLLIEQRADVSDIDAPWKLPGFVNVPSSIAEQLAHASRFSAVINGAPLLYNLLLAEKSTRADKAELREDFEHRLADWAGELRSREHELGGWDRTAFWELVASAGTTTPWPTRRFIDRWFDLAVEGDPGAIAGNLAARKLIIKREREVKTKKRARLQNPQSLALWGGDAGTARLAYRWPNAQRVISDIVAGLEDRGA